MISRRSFLQTTAAGTCGALAAARAGGEDAADGPILERTGVALYTVRDLMKQDPAGTLAAIAKLGYRYVEGGLVPSLAPAVAAAGLRQVSAYAPPYLVTGNRQAWSGGGAELLPESYTWDQAVEEARGRRLQYLVIAYLQKAERGSIADYRRLAAKLDAAGAACRKAGLTLAYHAHAFEHEPQGGVRPLDVLLQETAPAHLALELDTFWVSIAGRDPVALLAEHKGRVPLVHLKDKAKGTPVQYDDGAVPREAFKEVGNGEVDFAAFFRAAAAAGVRYFYVEQDHCLGSTPLDSLRASRAQVQRLTV